MVGLSGEGRVVVADRVIITGFMGSGKSVVGRRLAQATGMAFVDTDELAEARMGCTISQAFATRGEEYFRGIEAEVINDLLSGDADSRGEVISLGGGAVTRAKNRELLERQDNVVQLEVDGDTAFSRAQNGQRPLAADKKAFLLLLEKRRADYAAVADITVDASRGIDEIVKEIRDVLERKR